MIFCRDGGLCACRELWTYPTYTTVCLCWLLFLFQKLVHETNGCNSVTIANYRFLCFGGEFDCLWFGEFLCLWLDRTNCVVCFNVWRVCLCICYLRVFQYQCESKWMLCFTRIKAIKTSYSCKGLKVDAFCILFFRMFMRFLY